MTFAREVTMKTLAMLLILAAAPGLAAAQTTKDELKKLAKAGIADDVIVAYIKANGIAAKPSSEDLVNLKAAGIGDRVLTEILATTPTAPPAPAVARGKAETPAKNAANTYRSGYYVPVYPGYPYRYHPAPYYYRPYYRGYYRYPYYYGPRYAARYGWGVRVGW